jgi:hypothetical protein
MSAPATKYCPDCKNHVPISQFHKNSRKGRATYCKQHWRARYQPLRSDNPEHDAIREWAERTGERVPKRGPLPQRLIDEYKAAHSGSGGINPLQPATPPRQPAGSSTSYAEIYGLSRCPQCGGLFAGSQCYQCPARIAGIFQELRNMGR